MKTMVKILCICIIYSISAGLVIGQSKVNDIPVDELPSNVKDVLVEYIAILKSESLDICYDKFKSIAGGTLVNESGTNLRTGIKDYSLKKDFQDIKFYKDPPEITRVNKTMSNGQGYGASAIKGYVYKVWIAKIDPSNGMPAPVSIMVPEDHPTIKTPKVVNIGSF
ncbi:MAG: hypothetical protein JXB49_35265 [Bacteroidales bacterium]|nr:hypothetical protein [Bacteroidales bacterium]